MARYKITIQMLVELYGQVDSETTLETINNDILVELHSAQTPHEDIDPDDVDISFSYDAPAEIEEIPTSKLDFYGLEESDDLVAYLVRALVMFEFETEAPEGTVKSELLKSIELDWETYSEEFDLSSGGSKLHFEEIVEI